MENVVLVIHLILALAIIVLVLIQRSEGGGLGIGGGSGGGGGGMGGFATPKGTASALTKMTAFFAACFFITSLTLAILAGTHNNQDGILSTYAVEAEATIEGNAVAATEDGAEGIETPVTDSETARPDVPEEKPSVPIGN